MLWCLAEPLWHERWAGAVATAQVTDLLVHLLSSQAPVDGANSQLVSNSITICVLVCSRRNIYSSATQHSHAVALLC